MRVLYIEDSIADAMLTVRAVKRSAPEIVLDQASTVTEGLTRLAGPQRYDMVVTDLNLTDGTGLDVLTWIRTRAMPVAVVILTGSGDLSSAIAALKAGADDYLIKRDDYLQVLPDTLRAAQLRFRCKADRGSSMVRVLHVDPDVMDTEMVRRHLAQHAPHIQVMPVPDAEQALEQLPKNSGQTCDFDLVLTEHLLPGMDGLELTKVLREERRLDLPVVLVTRHGSEEIAARALRMGVDDYLAKHEGWLFEVVATLEKVRQRASLLREQAVRQARNAMLDQLVSGAALSVILEDIARRLEAIEPTQKVSILLIDEHRHCLVNGASPSLPRFYVAAVEGLVPGEGRGSCGTAAWRGEAVVVGDVATHPYWEPYREITLRAGVRACWSVPFKDESGRVLGTFAIYRAEPGEATRAQGDCISPARVFVIPSLPYLIRETRRDATPEGHRRRTDAAL